ncbi:MAG: class I adenylate-forming enzyme family protein [Xanthobacteraceae bacterium]
MRVENVSAAILSNARRRPNHIALMQARETVSCVQLEQRVAHAAGALRKRGVTQGEIVAVSMGDTIDQIVMIFALMRLGAVMLPMDVRWTPAESLRVAEFFSASTLLLDHAEIRANKIKTIRVDDGWNKESVNATPITKWHTTSESPIVLSLSSGTTGIPKGPMVSHGLYIRRMFYELVTNGTSQDEINMLATPLYFGGGRNITLMNIIIGATVVLYPPPYQIEDLVRSINDLKVTSVFVVPTLLRRMLALPYDGGLLFPNLRIMMSSGAVLHKEELQLARQRLTPNLVNVYATTEAGVVTQLMPTDSESKAGSVGRPVFLADVQVTDDNHQTLPPGEVGRIRYRTLAVPDGFYNNPEESARSFHDGWFYPGDLGKLDSDGYLYVVGRGKDMIIRGGINIYPADIEAVLNAHPSVLDASVLGWAGGEMGEEIAAFVARKGAVSEDELTEYCRGNLARYKVPKRIFFVDQMPRNDAGKVIKAKLAALLPAAGV